MFGLVAGFEIALQDGAFLSIVCDAGIKICVIFLLAAATARLLRRSSASIRHLVWLVAMASFIVTPILSALLPSWSSVPLGLAFGNATLDAARDQVAGLPLPTIEREARRLKTADESRWLGSEAESEDRRPPRSASASASVLPGLSSIALAVWLFGCGSILLRTVISGLVLDRVARTAKSVDVGPIRDEIQKVRSEFDIRRRVDACLSVQRGTPMTWGVLRAHLLLPSEASEWEPSMRHAVLLHELAHVKRRDTATHVFAQLVLAIFWFHPLVWIAARRLHVECEIACDDLVLRSGVKASDYAEMLLGLLVARSVPGPALAMIGQCDLEGRLRAILDEKLDRRSISRRMLIAATFVALLSTASVASVQTSSGLARPEDEKPPTGAGAAAKVPKLVEKVVVSCVDSDGKPVPGAEVYVFQFTGPAEGGRFVQTGPFTADDAGRAECSEATLYDGNKYDRWFYARVPGRLVGAGRTAKWKNRAAFNTENRVVLKPSRTLEGRVVVPAGVDPTKVAIRVRTMQIKMGSGPFDYQSFTREDHFPGLNDALPDRFECRPDAEGRVRFSDVPERGRLYLVSRSSGLAEAQWSNYRNKDGLFLDSIFMEIVEESLLTGQMSPNP